MTEPAPRTRAPVASPLSAIVAAALIAADLAAAWFVPALAMVVVWPLLFVVPGWAIVGWLRPRISATGRLGVAIMLSVAISAHLVYWLSVASGGYRRESIFAAAANANAPRSRRIAAHAAFVWARSVDKPPRKSAIGIGRARSAATAKTVSRRYPPTASESQ